MDFGSFTLLAATDDLGMEPAARADAGRLELRVDFADEPLSQLDAYEPVDPADATAPGQYDLATLWTLVGQLQSDA